jgi:hypothetical protein
MRLFTSIIWILVSSSVVMATDIEPMEEFVSLPQEEPVTPPKYQEPAEYQELEYQFASYSNDWDDCWDGSYSE